MKGGGWRSRRGGAPAPIDHRKLEFRESYPPTEDEDEEGGSSKWVGIVGGGGVREIQRLKQGKRGVERSRAYIVSNGREEGSDTVRMHEDEREREGEKKLPLALPEILPCS